MSTINRKYSSHSQTSSFVAKVYCFTLCSFHHGYLRTVAVHKLLWDVKLMGFSYLIHFEGISFGIEISDSSRDFLLYMWKRSTQSHARNTFLGHVCPRKQAHTHLLLCAGWKNCCLLACRHYTILQENSCLVKCLGEILDSNMPWCLSIVSKDRAAANRFTHVCFYICMYTYIYTGFLGY